MKTYKTLFAIVISLIAISSCSSQKEDDLESLLEEWIGKEILFPESLKYVRPAKEPVSHPKFTVVAYFDSIGCSGCRMNLNLWDAFLDKANAALDQDSVRMVVISQLNDERLLTLIGIDANFKHDLAMDCADSFYKMNEIPDSEIFHFMLLDENNNVLAVGNPIMNPQLTSHYMSLITSETDEDFVTDSFDFGRIRPGEDVSHIFKVRNESNDTLTVQSVTSSCECTVGRVSTRIIPPNGTSNLEVSFNDTISGDFERSISVTFENNKPALHYVITGTIN